MKPRRCRSAQRSGAGSLGVEDGAPLREACVARRRLQKQLPSETRRWIHQTLHGLERLQRFEDAYALRMELADWVLAEENGPSPSNLTVEALLHQQHPDQDPLVLG